jgi:hypothetical protein
MTRKRWSRCAACIVILAGGAFCQAAPEIQNISPRGLRIGATTTVAIDGADLLPDSRLLLPLAVAKQSVKPESTANRLLIDITLAKDLAPGHYLLRLANSRGISNAVLMGVDDLPQLAMASEVANLPVALTGNLSAGGSVTTSFAGKKGQRVVVDLEARRLGANFDPVLELQDARRVPIASCQGKARLGGDVRVDTILPADGIYTALVRDALYQGGVLNQFRLKIGELHYADLALPLGIQRGTKATIQLLGNLPGDGRIMVQALGDQGNVPAALPNLPGMTGFAPTLAVGDYPEILEVDQPSGNLQEVAVPAAINGRLGKPNEEDRFRLLVKPGMQLRFDVLANRAGSPLDGVLALRNEAGGQYTASDDRGDTVDPGFEFTVPEKVNSVIVAIKDLNDRGGPVFVYRIAVTQVGMPDFSLSAQEERVNLPLGGTVLLRLRANRMGYNGPIKLSLPALPAGVVLSGQEIRAGATETLLTISAPPSLTLAPVVGSLFGESVEPNVRIRRFVMTSESAATRGQPWLRNEWGFAVVPAGPVAIAWDTNDPSLPLDYTYAARVKVTRAMGNQGPVRLSLLTTQVIPKTPDGKADDLNRALRVAGTPMIAAGQDAGQAPVIVPKDLPKKPYDLAIRAELLTPDGKQVLATAVTPSRRLTPVPPIVAALTSPATVEAVMGGSTGIKMKGTINRQGGFDKPVTVSLVGLPAGVTVPTAVVPDNKTDFELSLVFPASTKLGDLLNVKLVATSVLNPQATLRSNEVPIKLQIVAGDAQTRKP